MVVVTLFHSKEELTTAFTFAFFFMSAYFGKYLKETEQIKPKAFFAEVLLSIAGCGLAYWVGIGQELSTPNFMAFGIAAGLGYIQVAKFVMQQWKASVKG
ncbi:hypothetical protein [Vibrio harveyi]|uniref:hypothetical protein n=1 Tax=Vibrio harveyi TaxID=669 RepID=UPI00036824F1|nr:hypothetical protein [Vibrio harveyi]GEA22327.1 hypothetical protein VH1807_contig00024-0045 [Vibrio harveyi]HDM8166681.1 hypothetical protein [Vibrio harveyi]